MRVTSVLRLGLAWVTLPVGLVLGALYVPALGHDGSGLPLSEQVAGYYTIALVYPVVCLGACLLGSRLRQSRLLSGAAVVRRPPVLVFAALVLPLAAVAVTVFIVPVTVYAGAATSRYVPHPTVLGVATAHAIAYVSLAVALGLRVRPLVAAPLSVLVPFVFLGFPQGYEPRWLRHLTQIPFTCCQVYSVPDPRVIAAIVLVAAGVTCTASAIFLSGSSVSAARLLTVGVAVAALLTAVSLVRDQPYHALTARPGEPRCEPAGRTQLCVWPEHERFRAAAGDRLLRISDISERTGAPIPTRFTETIPDSTTWPEASIDLGPGADTDASIIGSLDPATTCRQRRPENGSDHSEEANPASEAIQFWWARKLGVQKMPKIGEEARDLVTAVDRRPGAGIDDLVRRSAEVSCGPGAA